MEAIVSLTPEVSPDPLQALAHPPEGTSIVELRADLLPELDVRQAVAACPLPLLFTLRSTEEGGKATTEPTRRLELVRAAHEAGAALIDLEFARDLDISQQLGLTPEHIVLSWHDFSGTPATLEETAAAMLEHPAHLVKLVTTAADLADVERVLALHRSVETGKRKKLVCFAMGEIGLPSRLLSPLLGLPITYAAWAANTPAAPGQLSLQSTRSWLGHLAGKPQRLYGVIGSEVSRSVLPLLFNSAFGAHELPYLFLPVRVERSQDLERLLSPAGHSMFDRLGLPAHGWVIADSFQEVAARMATVAAPRAHAASAADTVVIRGSNLCADTTVADAVTGSLKEAGMDPAGRSAVVQGIGPVARSVAYGLHLAGAEVWLRHHDGEACRVVADTMSLASLELAQRAPSGAILVNAGACGEAAFSSSECQAASVLLDVQHGSGSSQLAEAAAASGVPFIDANHVLVQQCYAQIAAFTGTLVSKTALRCALG